MRDFERNVSRRRDFFVLCRPDTVTECRRGCAPVRFLSPMSGDFPNKGRFMKQLPTPVFLIRIWSMHDLNYIGSRYQVLVTVAKVSSDRSIKIYLRTKVRMKGIKLRSTMARKSKIPPGALVKSPSSSGRLFLKLLIVVL